MKWFAVVIVLQTASKLVGSFDLPKPLDNFYEEVVRFYKRLRTEGGELFQKYFQRFPQTDYNSALLPSTILKIFSQILAFKLLNFLANFLDN